MIWLFQFASFTGAFPSKVNGINALGSLHSCSEDNILVGDKEENVFLADTISRSTECKPAPFLVEELSSILQASHARFTRSITKTAV